MTTGPGPAERFDPQEVAELLAAGGADPSEVHEFERRLESGDPACRAAWAAVSGTFEALAGAADPVEPPSGVRAALRRRLAAHRAFPAFAAPTSDPAAVDAARMVVLRREEMAWRDAGAPGVEVISLFVDREANKQTLLIRMAPGASYPDHEHPSVEECLVIEGDLEIAGTTLGRMDYLRTPVGGRHGEPRTTDGCVLLVTCAVAA